jgi:ABC-2 type transport system ATP-binding protein
MSTVGPRMRNDATSLGTRADAEVQRSELLVIGRGLRVRRGGLGAHKTWALDGVDIEVRAGESVALFGPNGAGKSTLLQVCAGVIAPDAGTIELAGYGRPSEPSARRAIGYVPQALAVYPRLTVRENLAFFARVLGVPRASREERVAYGLGVAQLEARAGSLAGTLSGGMQRRLSFACGVVHAPALLLLDEPTSGVDAASRAHLYAAIDAQRRQGTAIVCATHHEDEAARVCERVLALAAGRELRAHDHVASASAAPDTPPRGRIEELS